MLKCAAADPSPVPLPSTQPEVEESRAALDRRVDAFVRGVTRNPGVLRKMSPSSGGIHPSGFLVAGWAADDLSRVSARLSQVSSSVWARRSPKRRVSPTSSPTVATSQPERVLDAWSSRNRSICSATPRRRLKSGNSARAPGPARCLSGTTSIRAESPGCAKRPFRPQQHASRVFRVRAKRGLRFHLDLRDRRHRAHGARHRGSARGLCSHGGTHEPRPRGRPGRCAFHPAAVRLGAPTASPRPSASGTPPSSAPFIARIRPRARSVSKSSIALPETCRADRVRRAQPSASAFQHPLRHRDP